MKNLQSADIQQIIKQIKFDKNLTQHQLADILSISRNGIDRFMTGKRDKYQDIIHATQLKFPEYFEFVSKMPVSSATAITKEIKYSLIKTQEKYIALLEEILENRNKRIEKLKNELDICLKSLRTN